MLSIIQTECRRTLCHIVTFPGIDRCDHTVDGRNNAALIIGILRIIEFQLRGRQIFFPGISLISTEIFQRLIILRLSFVNIRSRLFHFIFRRMSAVIEIIVISFRIIV